ncbi:group II truncated hemoglobin [Pseudomonas stutzeri]|uniref:group II truncated hemoglobin n=1 Tax=Stutzerimonas stutzeri TaxID=316 RepID=UPI0021095E73|nr:group II truncated hemoglobin [Stutzerimonas stutzeri]MCQ4312041.1 group II truncated hemoglobin [Stutzerimonas stutzeri]
MSTTCKTPFGVGDASFQAAGGEIGIECLVADFYRIMDETETAACVRLLYPEDLSASRERLAAFLSGWLGGPRRYAETYGSISIPQFHTRWTVGEAERDAWLDCMALAISRQDYTADFAAYLLAQLRVPAERILQAGRQACPARPQSLQP